LSDPFAELPAKDRRPQSARILDNWIRDAEKFLGPRGERTRWVLASTIVAAALQRVTADRHSPLFLLKGGVFIERALNLQARATKDLDTIFRGTVEELELAMDDALAEPWGVIELSRSTLETIDRAPVVTKPRRFFVYLDIRGVRWAKIKVEVSFEEGAAGNAHELITAPSTAYFGIEQPTHLATIAMAYQVAQKLHACSAPHEPPEYVNTRVRDIVDLLLIKRAFYPSGSDLTSIREAALDVFGARATYAMAQGPAARGWPPALMSNDVWAATWDGPSDQAGFALTLAEAIDEVEAWIVEIDSAAPTAITGVISAASDCDAEPAYDRSKATANRRNRRRGA
jgi:hypothetical protein